MDIDEINKLVRMANQARDVALRQSSAQRPFPNIAEIKRLEHVTTIRQATAPLAEAIVSQAKDISALKESQAKAAQREAADARRIFRLTVAVVVLTVALVVIGLVAL